MRSLAEEAEYLRLAMRVGALTPREVVSWADSMIARLGSPPTALIEVALGPIDDSQCLSRRLRILSDRTSEQAASPGPMRRVFRLLHARLDSDQMDHRDAASALYALSPEAGKLTEDEEHALIRIDDEFCLAESGYCEFEAAKASLVEFLGGYAGDLE